MNTDRITEAAGRVATSLEFAAIRTLVGQLLDGDPAPAAARLLARRVRTLDERLTAGGPLPLAWDAVYDDWVAQANYCPECGRHADFLHLEACRYATDGDGVAVTDGDEEDGACPADPDGLHHAGCGCEDVDPINPN